MLALYRRGVVSAVVLVTLSLGFATAHAVAPGWSHDAGLDLWNLRSANEELRQASEEGIEIQYRIERWAKRREIADHTAMKLSRGLPLSAAVDELMEVYEDEPDMVTMLEATHFGAPSVRHLFALFAISRVKVVLTDPVERKTVVAHLEAEYKSLDWPPEGAASH